MRDYCRCRGHFRQYPRRRSWHRPAGESGPAHRGERTAAGDSVTVPSCPALVPGIPFVSATFCETRWPGQSPAMTRCDYVFGAGGGDAGRDLDRLAGEENRAGRRAAWRTTSRLERHRVGRRTERIEIDICRQRALREFVAADNAERARG